MFIVYTVIHPVFKSAFNQFIIKEFLLKISLLDTDTDRITQIIDDA
jgi:hypothetical protein